MQHFEELEDPRPDVNLRQPLVRVVVIAIMAVLAGAGGPAVIAKWAVMKEELLLRLLPLPNGIPRTNVSRRVRSEVEAGDLSSLLRGVAARIACPGLRGDRRLWLSTRSHFFPLLDAYVASNTLPQTPPRLQKWVFCKW